MSQHDLNIANQTAAAVRSDINNALLALGSNSSGASAPSSTYSNMFWYDTSSNILKLRNEADSAWINIGYVDQSGGVFSIIDNTKVVTTSNSQTGLLGDQTTSTWNTGTGTTESLVSPAKLKSAVLANAAAGYTQPTTAGAVGTYAWLGGGYSGMTTGASVAGSTLVYASVDSVNGYNYNTVSNGITGGAPAGTWRCMGSTTSLAFRATLFLRIS
tara:strand:- start:11 stop:655 length:645 start_codon:yes stop_codon:yes gene_type:complete